LAGILNVDTLKADSNLRLQIASANVAFIDASGLNMLGSNLVIGGSTITSTQLSQLNANGTISAAGIASVNANTITTGTIPVTQVPRLTTAKMPAGSILQVVQTNTGGSVSATNVGNATFFFERSFVPISSTSRIMIMASIGGVDNGGSGRMAINILKDTTSGGTTGQQAFQMQSAQDSTTTNGISGLSGFYIYDGGTFTAGTTYYIKAIAYKNDTSTAWTVGIYSNDSSITVMEIAT